MDILSAQTRTDFKRSTLNRLRKSGYIPGILYGKNMENIPIAISESQIREVLKNGTSRILQMAVGEQNYNVMIYETQRDPLTGKVIHIDFKKVSLDEKVETEIPIQIIGRAKEGVISQQLRELSVRCYPKDLLENIIVHVSELKIGDVIKVHDLDVPETIEILNDPNEIVLIMSAPQMDPVETDEEATPSEPEIVGAKDGPGIDAAK